MTVYILGGGPTGLALAHSLAGNSDIFFVVIEREGAIGGLAKTVQWKDYGFHDLGPHKIFILDKDLMSRVESLLPSEDWLTREKKSSIYMKGHFLPYPPSPLSLASVYGLINFVGMVLDYGKARIHNLIYSRTVNTFEDDLVNRLGCKLYEALFKPIAMKLWGYPSNLDVKLSKGRVQTPSLTEVISRLLKIRSSSSFEALNFRYPKGGIQKIWEAIVFKTKNQGTYFLNHKIEKIIVENNKVCKIIYKDKVTGKEKEARVKVDDFLFSTIPLLKLTEIMGNAITIDTKECIKKIIQLNDLILVFLKIDKTSLLDESWVFVPDPEIIFHRLSEQESFDLDMTPGGSIICCEIMSNETRRLNEMTDKELIAAAKKGLHDMGYKSFSVIDQKVMRLPASYPVFRPGFEPDLEKILDELDLIENFRTIGRQGAFNYIGTLDAMDIGYGAARWFMNRRGNNSVRTWKEERQRTKHYPVLD
ncbi:MAG: hypothetical protein FJ242_01600 [Nitrospira sp.]|nr:hypothetical protein [Nitrospira sp.]